MEPIVGTGSVHGDDEMRVVELGGVEKGGDVVVPRRLRDLVLIRQILRVRFLQHPTPASEWDRKTEAEFGELVLSSEIGAPIERRLSAQSRASTK